MEITEAEYEEFSVSLEELMRLVRKQWEDEAYDDAFQVWLSMQWIGKQKRRKWVY